MRFQNKIGLILKVGAEESCRRREGRSYKDLGSERDGEDKVGVGRIVEEAEEGGGGRGRGRGGGRDPSALRTTVTEFGRERNEIGRGGGERRVVEEARELNLPLPLLRPFSNGDLYLFARYRDHCHC